MGDKIDTTINSVTAAIIGVVLVCSALIPIAVGQLDFLDTLGEGVSQYASLISVVVIVTIVGLIIGVIKTYSGGQSDR